MMNWIWLGLIAVSVLVAGFTGNMEALMLRIFGAAKEAVMDLALPLVGVMAFFIGLMRVAQDAGLMRTITRVLRRPMRLLFPDVPEDHPAMSAMILNFGANMMGLANAATPFGIKAMMELDRLNRNPGTATDAMCMFLAINTSSLALLPTGVMGFRAVSGSTDPASIWLPTLLCTATTTTVGILMAKWLQHLRRFQIGPEELRRLADQRAQGPVEANEEGGAAPEEPDDVLGGAERAAWPLRAIGWLFAAAFVGAAVYHYGFVAQDVDGLGIVEDFFSIWAIPALVCGLLMYGLARKVRVYESLVEGAKEGFRVAVRIIPYLVAILVAVAMFRTSGAMELMKGTVGRVTAWLGMPAEALPMAIIRSLSGNGAFGYMGSIFNEYGPDSFLGKMVSVMQGSTETTFYVLAVYFGSVQVYRVRHALAAGLSADLAGIVAAVALSNAFF